MDPRTYEQIARAVVLPMHTGLIPQVEARIHYADLFLIDYERALNGIRTSPEAFIAAYNHKVLAIMHGASADRLDLDAYAVRQAWAAAQVRQEVTA